jgi:hypothetical protein
MKHAPLIHGQDYAVLRQTGSSPRRARDQLQLAPVAAGRLEKVFSARAARGQGDPQLPKFARHDRHVAAVLAQGGFWALSERRVGGDGLVVCLPLVRGIP